MAKSTKSTPSSKTNKPAPLEGNAVWRKRGRVRKAGPVQDKTWWEARPAWAQHAICVGFLVIVALGFTAPTTFGGKSLVGDDIVRWRASADVLLDAERSAGELPLWAPNVFGGMPAYLIHDTAGPPGADDIAIFLRRIGLWPVGHLLVLLLGAYALVVFLTRSKLAGVIGAVGFGLSTYLPIILVAGHNSKFIALAYVPWLLLAFGALIRRPTGMGLAKSALLTGLFAIAASVSLRAGHIQITYYAVIVAVVWWIAEGIADLRNGQARAFFVGTLLLAVGSALALAMVAHPYLVQWEYKAYTIRAAGPGGGLAWEYAMAWSQGAGELLTLLVADAYGGASPTYWGPKVFTSGPHYVGPVVGLLALVGAVGVARRSVAAFGLAALLTIGFALGEHLPMLNRPAFELLPLFDSFRVPETWLSITALLLALLAGWGAYYVARREATPEATVRKRRLAMGAAAVLGAVCAALWLAGPSLLALQKEGEGVQIQQQMEQAALQQGLSPQDPRVEQEIRRIVSGVRQERAEALQGDALRSLSLLGLAALLIALVLWRRVPNWVGLAALGVLATVDLWGVGRRHFNEDAPAMRSRARVEAAIPTTDADRFVEQLVAESGGLGRFRTLPSNPSQNADAPAFSESVGGYHGAKLALIQDYFERLLPDDTTGLNARAVDLLGARYLVLPGVLPGTTPLFQDERTGVVVAENPTALPRAFLVDSVEVIEDTDALIDRIRDPETRLRRVALLSEALPDGVAVERAAAPRDSARADTVVAPANRLSRGVVLDRFEPDEIVWTVRTEGPALFVANEVYYPAGWTATVDDQPAPILRANFLHRAVPVPAGEHLVRMTFDPPTRRLGLRIAWIASLLVYLLTLGLGGLVWYREGKDRG